MTDDPTWLRYRAADALVTSAEVWVVLRDGRPHAHVARGATADHRLRWAWTGGGVHDFAVEAEPDQTSFLITDPNGAPFGRIRQHGFLRPRLLASDAAGERFAVDLDGRIHACDGDRTVLGWLDLRSSREVDVRLSDGLSNPTLRHLLAAAPLCHAVQALSLLATRRQ